MRHFKLTLSAIGVLGLALPAWAQSPDFNVTYHVERTPAAQLSIETCGQVVTETAAAAGLGSASQTYPGQLVTVTGGQDGRGGFIVQCIAVDDTTVTVVQGIDYQPQKAGLGAFADQAFAAVLAARH